MLSLTQSHKFSQAEFFLSRLLLFFLRFCRYSVHMMVTHNVAALAPGAAGIALVTYIYFPMDIF